VTAQNAAQPDRPDETAPPSDGGAASTGPAADVRIDAGPAATSGNTSNTPGNTSKKSDTTTGSNAATDVAAGGDGAAAGEADRDNEAAAGISASGDTTTIDLEVTMADGSHGKAGKPVKSAPKTDPEKPADAADGSTVDDKSSGGKPGAASGDAIDAASKQADAESVTKDDQNGTKDEDVKKSEAAEDAAVTSADQSGDELDGQSLYAELDTLRGDLGELTRDLQRVTAEYANYRKRVERDRTLAGEQATAGVLMQLLPVLDDLDRARDHGDLVGPFGSVAEQLVATLTKFGLTPFGEPGDAFDPTVHEAVSHTSSPDVSETTCIEVMRRGYLFGDRLLRAALVAVADPE